jgi:putative hydrolase
VATLPDAEHPAYRAAGNGDPALNARIADRLREMAELLDQQHANPFRVGAYRRAADTVARLDRGVGELVRRQGLNGLVALPGIGRGIGAAILEMVNTGRWAQLERLRGGLEPERLFQIVPGIGPQLAARIHEALDVDTLEGLEQAAHDGRLEAVPGVGARRTAAVRAALQAMLGRTRSRRPRPDAGEPSIALLLEVDHEYRDKASAGRLPKIAPRRFNPSGEAWLPILHAERDGWHFTALYSNTARAHELGRTGDWVVIYFYDQDHQEGQRTVVTETRGPRAGQRVVRGREQD